MYPMYLKTHCNQANQNIARQKGNLLVITLVIIVVLLMLGLALVKILSASAQQNVIEYYGARAYMAAQSGLENALTELFPLNIQHRIARQYRRLQSFKQLILKTVRLHSVVNNT